MADFSSLQKTTASFFLDDCDIYILDGTAAQDWKLVGYTGAVKSITPGTEFASYETGLPRSIAARKKIRETLTLSFDLMQYDEDLFAYICGGNYSTNSSGAEISIGTVQPVKKTYATRIVGMRDDAKWISLTVYKGEWDFDGSLSFGGEEYNRIPVHVHALFDAARNENDNLYRWNIWNTGISVTADTP